MLANVLFADWAPDGAAMAVVREIGSRQRLEYPVGKVLFETDGELGFPRVSPSGDRVAFLDWPVKSDDRGSVAVIDRSGARQTISRVWEGVRGLAWTHDGGEVWYTAARSGTMYSLWGAGPGRAERPIFAAPVGMVLEDIGRDGRVLLSRYDRSTEVVVWQTGDARETELSWLDHTFARDVSADGSHVLLSSSGEGSSPDYDVYVCGIDGSSPTKIGEGQAQQFSPDGTSVVSIVHGPPSRILILPIGAGESRVVPAGNIAAIGARWLKSGKQLLVVGAEPGKRSRAYVVGIDGSGLRPVSPEGVTYTADRLALAPDDSRVALRGPDGRVMLYPLAGGEPVAVKGLAPDEVPVGWAPDGRGLMLQEKTPSVRLIRLDPTTGARETLLDVRAGSNADRTAQVLSRPGARGYVLNAERLQMTLFLAEGLK